MCLTSVNQEEPGAKIVVILSLRRTESVCTSSIVRMNRSEAYMYVHTIPSCV